MTNEQSFDAWAPPGGRWTGWAKPVLFAEFESTPAPGAENVVPDAPDMFWAPDPGGRTAIIVDLPGVSSVAVGLSLARRGYRPVPLYNTSIGPAAAVDAQGIARALRHGSDTLLAVSIGATAPPAFLIDSRRMRPATPPSPGQFDNRWVVFPQDFPSATYLRSHGVAEVLILADQEDPQEDLAHVLLRWQQAGIRILGASPPEAGRVRDVTVKRPSRFRGTWYRLLIAAGLHRNSAGGFGGIVPRAGTGG